MSDKSPKGKRKLQAQHEMLKKQKNEQMHQSQERLHESFLLKHPHEIKE